ncbi:MAG TPA: hypothetical protein VML94_01890 [Thermoplasmata archaeon]|nr:hypothetical protein [Thermoplasmata archaeon]
MDRAPPAPRIPPSSRPLPGRGSSTAPSAPVLADLGKRLEETSGYDGIFRIVRAVVHRVLGIERPGLGLALSNLPPQLGAYWPVTGNLIVLNEGLVAAMRASASSPLEVNSFVYVVLAHEYLHSLGYLDETSVRAVTARVTHAAFGPDHLATRMAEGDLWKMYPFLAHAPTGDGRRLRIVPGFDLASTQNYIR